MGPRVHLKAPGWWEEKSGVIPLLLSPVSWAIGAIMRAQWSLRQPRRAGVPVICIGNLSVGGAGKTPTAIAVADLLKALGEQPGFLSRGYGGTNREPHLVDPDRDDAREVGDEPLLLARHAPTVIAADRPKGAAKAAQEGASAIVMDDGFQNPSLAKDLSLIVIDAEAGIGNGRVLPSGPLRAPLGFQLARCDGLIVIGNGTAAEPIASWMQAHKRPVLAADLLPDQDTAWLTKAPVLAFAGIGRPEKFFKTLEAEGGRLVDRVAFADHHRFTETDASRLLSEAKSQNAQLVTTEKDWVRLPANGGPLGELKSAARPLPVRLRFADEGAAKALLEPRLGKGAKS